MCCVAVKKHHLLLHLPTNMLCCSEWHLWMFSTETRIRQQEFFWSSVGRAKNQIPNTVHACVGGRGSTGTAGRGTRERGSGGEREKAKEQQTTRLPTSAQMEGTVERLKFSPDIEHDDRRQQRHFRPVKPPAVGGVEEIFCELSRHFSSNRTAGRDRQGTRSEAVR